jgi:hypothetical protein
LCKRNGHNQEQNQGFLIDVYHVDCDRKTKQIDNAKGERKFNQLDQISAAVVVCAVYCTNPKVYILTIGPTKSKVFSGVGMGFWWW